ncbi:MAG: hypothetical protein RLO12_13995, partial [Fulvivirga sp.]
INSIAQAPAYLNRATALKEMPVAPPEVEGSSYLNEDWVQGNIEIKKNTLIEDVPLRYDLENQALEIKYEDEVRICPLDRIQNFSYLNLERNQFKYFNTSEINNIGFDLPKGICRVLVKDNTTLIKHIYTVKVEGTYNLALSMGDPGHKIMQKETPYAIVDDKVYEVKNSFKRNSDIFGDKSQRVKAFVKKNKLKFKSEKDLIEIFEFHNSLQ